MGGHRGVPETRGGPGVQDQPKFPSPGELKDTERLLGGKMGHSSLPLLVTLILYSTPPSPQGSAVLWYLS